MFTDFTIIHFIVLLMWFASAFVDYNEYTYLWQLKEYRWDRFRDYLTTREGKKYFWNYRNIGRASVVLLVLILHFYDRAFLAETYAILLLVDLVLNAKAYSGRKLRRPRRTQKSFLILVSAFIVEAGIIYLTRSVPITLILLAIRIDIVALIVFMLWGPTKIAKYFYVKKAAKKLHQYKKLKVIGITGSYGKTTTKELLAELLGKKFRVAKTPENINTEIGIAQCILKTDFEGVDIFVVEMGAYKEGEIAKICNLVNPCIGILIAINEQHLSLFGSIEKTRKAKFELLKSVPKDGLVITNSDSDICAAKDDGLMASVQTFGYDDEKNPTLSIQNVFSQKGGENVRVGFGLGGGTLMLNTKLRGEHYVTNLAAAVLAAKWLGMSVEEIIHASVHLTVPQRVQNTFKYGKATIIDDTYNSNPEGFRKALDLLSSFPSDKQRIVITRGMVELGDRSDVLHEELGGEIAYIADTLVVISNDSAEAMKRGVTEKYRTQVVTVLDQNELLDFIKSYKDNDCVILLENRIPEIVSQEIKK